MQKIMLTKEEIKRLIDFTSQPCVSLYMSLNPLPEKRDEDRILFKNLLTEAERQLSSLAGDEGVAILAPAKELLEAGGPQGGINKGAAVFIGPDFFQVYLVRAPFKDLCVTYDAFHTKPLLPLMEGGSNFYVLAVSLSAVRLIKADRFTAEVIEMEGVPGSLEEAQKFTAHQKHVQQDASGGAQHGQGRNKDDQDIRLAEFLREVDKGLSKALIGEKAPVVLAGVEYVLGEFKKLSSRPELIAADVKGNPDALSENELAEKAMPLLAAHFDAVHESAAEELRRLLGTGMASTEAAEILPAAMHGRLKTLFVPVGVQVWGMYDQESETAVVHEEKQPGDRDLLDIIAARAFATGSEVHALEPDKMPGAVQVAAVMRF